MIRRMTSAPRTMPSGRRRRRGQGMTEYIIIVGLIAILLVGAVNRFKTALGNAYDTGTDKLEGIATEIGDGSTE